MQILLLKLQGSARNKWSRNILNICREHKRKPDLQPASQNLLSVIQYFQKRQLNSTWIKSRIAEKPKFNFLLHKMMAKYMLKRNHCIYCSEDHKSDSCNSFVNQTMKERIHFLARTKICCGSLQSMEDEHNPKSCKKRLSWIKLARKSTLHHYMLTSLRIRRSLVIEIIHKMIKRKLVMMSNLSAY